MCFSRSDVGRAAARTLVTHCFQSTPLKQVRPLPSRLKFRIRTFQRRKKEWEAIEFVRRLEIPFRTSGFSAFRGLEFRSMSMMRFGLLFPQLAEGETRTAIILEPSARNGYLPADEYGMDELYCTERRCDCRRVMINVLARRARRHVATINHAFEPPAQGDPVPEQTFLDPLNKQSELAPALLELFQNTV